MTTILSKDQYNVIDAAKAHMLNSNLDAVYAFNEFITAIDTKSSTYTLEMKKHECRIICNGVPTPWFNPDFDPDMLSNLFKNTTIKL